MLRWLPILIIIIVIFTLSSQPYKEQNIQPALKNIIHEQTLKKALPDVTFKYTTSVVSAQADPYGFVEFFIRKWMHLTIYGLLGLAAWLASRKIGWAIPIVVLVASLDEWNQARGEGRTGTPYDVLVDLTGALIAIVIVKSIMNYRTKRRISA